MYEPLFNVVAGWGGANLNTVKLFTQNQGIRPFLRIVKWVFLERKRRKKQSSAAQICFHFLENSHIYFCFFGEILDNLTALGLKQLFK